VRLRALVEGGRLVLEVQDDGRGLNAPARPGVRRGSGMAVDNIRQRLAGHYGDEASLELRALPKGTLARITLPLQQSRAA
jgi:LytS/YehU family sensor histidine kinase